jgi:endonuclease-3
MPAEVIHQIVRILKKETRQWPVPAIGNYIETPFTVLISCLLSLRTQDKTTNAASDRLFAIANTPKSMLAVPVGTIEKAIYPVSFYRVKAKTIHAICRELLERFDGDVPSSMDELLSLPGVGRKTANIVITLAFQKAGIAVDTHPCPSHLQPSRIRSDKYTGSDGNGFTKEAAPPVLDRFQRSARRVRTESV